MLKRLPANIRLAKEVALMPEPKVRFKKDDGSSYPEWGTSSFLKTFNALNNNTYSRDMLNYDGGDAKNIHYGDILVKFGDICDIQKNNIPYVNEGLAIQKYGYLKDGDIILADTAEDETVGKAIEIYNIKNDIVISGLHTMAWRPVESFASKYLGHYLNSPAFHNQLKPYMQGVKVTSIGRANIAKVGVSFPESLEEQQKIADFLSSVDDVISASEEEVENLEKQKKAVMKKIFSQEVRFKRADGTEFPEWEEKDLIELFPNIRNGFVGTVTNFFTEKEKGIRYLEGTNIHDGLISDNVELYVTKAFHKKHINNELKADDIIMVQSGHVGDCAVVGEKYAGASCHALIIMSNAGNCHSDFYVAYFHSPAGMKEIAIKSTGNTVKHILASVMQGFRVPYPCLEEQRLIADFLSDFDEAIAAAKKELVLWKELKKGLLQQMFV